MTLSKKETLVSLGSPKFVLKPSASSSNVSNNSYISNPVERLVATLEEEEVHHFKHSLQSLVESMFPYESLYFGCKPTDY